MISAFGDVLLRIGVLSDALEALYGDGREWSLFSGEGLAVDAQGTTCILPDEERARAWGHGGLVVTIPSVEVPGLCVYQQYLPEKWGVAIMGGQVSPSGSAAYSERRVMGKLSLMSSNTDFAVKECRFTPDLELELKDAGEASAPASVDILGTQLRLNQTHLASTQKGESEPRSLSLTIDRGVLGGTPPARALRVSAFLCGDLPDHHLDCPQSAYTCRWAVAGRQAAHGTDPSVAVGGSTGSIGSEAVVEICHAKLALSAKSRPPDIHATIPSCQSICGSKAVIHWNWCSLLSSGLDHQSGRDCRINP